MPPPKKVKKVMTLPINVIFSHLQYVACCFFLEWLVAGCEGVAGSKHTVVLVRSLTYYAISISSLALFPCFMYCRKKSRVRIWLYEDSKMQIEGIVIGFDEYMNVVLDGAVEIDERKNARHEVGRILLKGDSITLIQEAQPVRPAAAAAAAPEE